MWLLQVNSARVCAGHLQGTVKLLMCCGVSSDDSGLNVVTTCPVDMHLLGSCITWLSVWSGLACETKWGLHLG